MLLDKFLEILRVPLFKRFKAVSIYMTKICALLAVVFVSIEFLAASASASDDNNVFVQRDNTADDAVSTRRDTAPTTRRASSEFNLNARNSIGRGRGGDRLLDVNSSSNLSFFPRDLALSEVLVQKMNQVFGACVQESATAAGLGNVSDINVSHMGGYVNRRVNNGRRGSNAWSLHSTGRALDIGRIDVTAGGKKYRIPMTKASHDGRNGRHESRFYKAFTACWAKEAKNRDRKSVV